MPSGKETAALPDGASGMRGRGGIGGPATRKSPVLPAARPAGEPSKPRRTRHICTQDG